MKSSLRLQTVYLAVGLAAAAIAGAANGYLLAGGAWVEPAICLPIVTVGTAVNVHYWRKTRRLLLEEAPPPDVLEQAKRLFREWSETPAPDNPFVVTVFCRRCGETFVLEAGAGGTSLLHGCRAD